jgi:hypothetical protein
MKDSLTLFDVADIQNEPRYANGQAIYQVVLDVVEHYTIARNFSMGADIYGDSIEAGQTLWRYHLDRKGGGHNVFGEYEMENVWFDNLDKAQSKALQNRELIERTGAKICAGALVLSKSVAWYKVRELDGHRLNFQAARTDLLAVFEQKPYCYPFLHIFDTEGEAKRYFDSLVSQLKDEGGIQTQFNPCDLYRVNDKLWSSYEYAHHQGKWDFLNNQQNQIITAHRPTNLQRHKYRAYER